MATKTIGNKEYVRHKTCPICSSKEQRCVEVFQDSIKQADFCINVTSNKSFDANGMRTYIHEVSADTRSNPVVRKPRVKKTPKKDIDLQDRVYRYFRHACYLVQGFYIHEDDLKDLQRRGVTKEKAEEWGIFSFPRGKTETAKVNNLLKNQFGKDLLKVAGFLKTKKGVTIFRNSTFCWDKKKYVQVEGYFFPYTNIDGKIEALQYRWTKDVYSKKGKKMRWIWFSSDVSSGSPICYNEVKNPLQQKDDVLLIAEGGLKGKIVSEKMRLSGLFLAGVNNHALLIKELKRLEKKTGKKYKLIIAFDMDKYTNKDTNGYYPVLEAEKSLVEKIKKEGNSVATVEWDAQQGKGLDDAMLNNPKLNRAYKIC